MSGRGAPPWATVRLRVAWGDVPPFGAELRTPSGRRYQVVEIRGKQMRCLVLPADAAPGDPVLSWYWSSRRKA